MKETPETLHRLEVAIGNLLRWGLLISASIVLVGATIYLFGNGASRADYSTFHGAPPGLTSLSGVFQGVIRFDGASIVQLGVLALIATPVARVLFSLFAFLYERDWLYTAFTAIVLAVLAYGLLS